MTIPISFVTIGVLSVTSRKLSMAAKKMKQLITRIEPGLHARLKRRAEDEGRSMNAIVTEALEASVDPPDSRAALRARAKRLGIPLEGGYGPPPSRAQIERRNAERDQAAKLGSGDGAILVDLILEERRSDD